MRRHAATCEARLNQIPPKQRPYTWQRQARGHISSHPAGRTHAGPPHRALASGPSCFSFFFFFNKQEEARRIRAKARKNEQDRRINRIRRPERLQCRFVQVNNPFPRSPSASSPVFGSRGSFPFRNQHQSTSVDQLPGPKPRVDGDRLKSGQLLAEIRRNTLELPINISLLASSKPLIPLGLWQVG